MYQQYSDLHAHTFIQDVAILFSVIYVYSVSKEFLLIFFLSIKEIQLQEREREREFWSPVMKPHSSLKDLKLKQIH